MAFSKTSILIVEDDSHISRVLRNHLELALPNVRVEIAGSASKAKQICEKFPPCLIIWDGAPNERGTEQEYLACVPDNLWSKVLPISVSPATHEIALKKGSHPPMPKTHDAINTWSEGIAQWAKKKLALKPKK